ncbi:SH3 domain-containing protein [Hymenobacter sp. B81]|uniref:SH3 domain-containing protein n=1 Tax=Hymenobacter sp. B81 TaxID=3344878 RepID=UPI0037DC1C2D
MKNLLWMALLGSACATSKDDVAVIPHRAEPVERQTNTQCGLYTTASTQSEMLTTVDSGARVLVLDSTNAYFVRASLSKDGKTVTGYMFRACLARR